MIVEGLTGLTMWFIELVFTGFQAVSLPANLVSVVLDIMKYGAWVMGGDLVAIFFATVFGWMSFKFTAGLLVWLWELLPLT